MPEEPSRGPHGYPDFQRVENWDGPTLVPEVTHTNVKGAFATTGTLDVGRYAALIMAITLKKGAYRFAVSWNSGTPGFEALGKREWAMQLAVGSQAYLRLPNLGPGVSVQAGGEGEPNEFNWLIGTTNRQFTQEATPVASRIFTDSSVYGPSAQKVFKIAALVTGTAHVTITTNGLGAGNILMKSIGPEGVERNVGFVNANEFALPVVGEFGIPLGPIGFVVSNGAKEQAIETSCIVTP